MPGLPSLASRVYRAGVAKLRDDGLGGLEEPVYTHAAQHETACAVCHGPVARGDTVVTAGAAGRAGRVRAQRHPGCG